MRPLAIGLFILWLLFEIGCEDSVVVTDVSGNYANTVEYPCLSSSNDCLSSMSVNGGTFPFFSSFHLFRRLLPLNCIYNVHKTTNFYTLFEMPEIINL